MAFVAPVAAETVPVAFVADDTWLEEVFVADDFAPVNEEVLILLVVIAVLTETPLLTALLELQRNN